MSDLPPVLDPPSQPVMEPAPEPEQPQEPQKPNWVKRLGPVGTALAFILAKLKAFFAFILPLLKFLKIGKVLLTGSTMLVSIWFYSLRFGWPLAATFVLGILVHEMGHVLMAWMEGVPVSAPMFIPGFGALIMPKREMKSAWQSAVIGIGGPLGGTLAGLIYYGLYAVTDNPVFLAAAYLQFFMNLFNLTPVYPMDGGRIVGAVSPYLWAVGLVVMAVMFFTGFLSNPLILILVLLGLPRLWTAFKHPGQDPFGGPPTSLPRRLIMGGAYVGLALFLVFASGMTHAGLDQIVPHHRSSTRQVAMHSTNASSSLPSSSSPHAS